MDLRDLHKISLLSFRVSATFLFFLGLIVSYYKIFDNAVFLYFAITLMIIALIVRFFLFYFKKKLNNFEEKEKVHVQISIAFSWVPLIIWLIFVCNIFNFFAWFFGFLALFLIYFDTAIYKKTT